MKKLLASALIAAFAIFFSSCKKSNLFEQNTAQVEVFRVKNKVDSWINQKKQLFNEVKKTNIELLAGNLQYSEAGYENYGSGKRILVIPVAEPYKQQKGVEKRKLLNLVLALDAGGEIETGNLVLFTPEAGKDIDRLPPGTCSKILNKTVPNADGRYQFLSIAGTFAFEIDFEGQNLHSFTKILQNPNTQSTRNSCIDWYWVTTYHYPDGSTCQTWDYVATTCNGEGCYDPELASICPGGDDGGNTSMALEPNENIDGVDNICESSFKFQQAVAPTNGAGGWRLAGTTGIRMQIVNVTTGEYTPILLPTMYFGLPIFRTNGEYYSESKAKEIAVDAVQFAEDKVMEIYLSNGGNVNVAGITLLFRQKINEYMQGKGGSATLSPGSNMDVSELGHASYGWPILGCL